MGPSFYLYGVNGGEDDLVGGDDNGEEFRGELQHCLILEHHSASSLDTRTFLNKSVLEPNVTFSSFFIMIYYDF